AQGPDQHVGKARAAEARDQHSGAVADVLQRLGSRCDPLVDGHVVCASPGNCSTPEASRVKRPGRAVQGVYSIGRAAELPPRADALAARQRMVKSGQARKYRDGGYWRQIWDCQSAGRLAPAAFLFAGTAALEGTGVAALGVCPRGAPASPALPPSPTTTNG